MPAVSKNCPREQLYRKSGSPIFQQKLNNLQAFLKKKKVRHYSRHFTSWPHY